MGMSDSERLYQAVIALNRDFTIEYGRLWIEGDAREQADIVRVWLESFAAEGLTGEDVERAHQAIRCDPAYRSYPPKRREVIEIARSAAHCAAGVAALIEPVLKMHRRFTYRYGYRWPRLGATEERERARFWAERLAELHLDAEDIAAGEQRLDEAGGFAEQPPSLEAFIQCVLESRSGEYLPEAEEAHAQACSSVASEALHPVVREARRRYGSYELRTQPPHLTRRGFSDLYAQLREQFLRREWHAEPLEESDASPEPPPVEVVSRDSLIATLDDLLSRYTRH